MHTPPLGHFTPPLSLDTTPPITPPSSPIPSYPTYSEITPAILNQYPTPQAKLDCIERHIAQDGSFKGLPFILTILRKKNPNRSILARIDNIRKKLVDVSLDRIERIIDPNADIQQLSNRLFNIRRQNQKVLKNFPELSERFSHINERLKQVSSERPNPSADLQNGEPGSQVARTTNIVYANSPSSSSDGSSESSGGGGLDRISTPTRPHGEPRSIVPRTANIVFANSSSSSSDRPSESSREVGLDRISSPTRLHGEPRSKVARTANILHASGLSSSSDGPSESSGGVELDRISSPTSLRVADQFSRAMFELSCRFLETPGLDVADVRAIIEQLETLCKQNSIKGEAALKLVEVYLNPTLGIRDLDKASQYYEIVCEEGCEVDIERFGQGFMELADFAMDKGHYSLCINLLKSKIGLPPEFYDSEISISMLPSCDIVNREMSVQILSRLSLAYYHTQTQNSVVAIRLHDLAALLGDQEIKESLISCFKETFKTHISDIESANKGFFDGIVKSDPREHQVNPAKPLFIHLLNESVKKGYITTSPGILNPLLTSIVANEALSRYFCSVGQKCDGSRACLERMIQLCDEITLNREENPYPLAAWMYVATNTTTQRLDPTRVERYATIAQQGGFSDPRTVGTPLYSDLEQRATSALFARLQQSLRRSVI